MHRRQVLAALAALVAGCGGQDATTDTPTTTATATPTDSPTPTPTATPTDSPTPTATGTPTPGAAERAGNEAIAEVQRTLDAAVATYGGADSDSILGTDASTTDFRSARVENALQEAEGELETARERAVTRDQQRTVERLAVAIRFLELAIQIQIALGNAFFALTRVQIELDREEGTDAREEIERMDNERALAVPPFEQLRSETDAVSVSVVPAIDTADYEAKVAQFEAEIATFGRLRSRLETLSRAVGRLNAARVQEANNSENAADTASRAAEELDQAAAALQSVLDSLPDAGDSLDPILQELVDLAEEKAADARAIAGETPTPTPTDTS